MAEPGEEKPVKAGQRPSHEGPSPFKLETIFEDATQIFKPNRVQQASSADVMIAVDTNVLLLPYTIRKDGLPTLQKFYQNLRAAERLYLPARVAREFIVHRDKKLAELQKVITDVRSRINIGETKLSPILEGVEGSKELALASKALAEAKAQYTRALAVVEGIVQSWSGDDPVTTIYESVFDATNIISPSQTNEEMLAEWEARLKERVPPGYKDAGKDDTGIGDFLVWKALLSLGAKQKRDLIFVTGEEKADWFVRVNGAGAYPRPELVAEYRKHSDGRSLRLVEFHDVLREMDVSQEVVSEVERVEVTAKNTIRATARSDQDRLEPTVVGALNITSVATVRMKYGGEQLSFMADGASFKFQVSECGPDSIWVYPARPHKMFSLLVGAIGQPIRRESLRSINKPFSLSKGEMTCFQDSSGFRLMVRLVSANVPQLNEVFEVSFAFGIFAPDHPIIVP